MASPLSGVDVVFGVGHFGYLTAGVAGNASSDKGVLQAVLDEFKKHHHNEIDTARTYVNGTSETFIKDLDYTAQGLIVDTKIRSFAAGTHTPEKIVQSLNESLHELNTNKVHILYLHSPDRETPFEVTLATVNELYKKGHFEEFGISNYSADEVHQIVKIAEEKGYVKPTVYQGLYNVLVRGGEDTLFPVLRKHGIRFYAYSPLAASFLTEAVAQDRDNAPRFDANNRVGKLFRDRFYKESHYQAVEKLREAAKKHELSLSEIALRWLAHHSLLKRATHDAVIIGGKTFSNIKQALDDLDKPALPADVLTTIEEVWQIVKGDAAAYHM